jgi:hypothetical protein
VVGVPDAGAVHVDVLPDLKKFGPQLRAELRKHAANGVSIPVGLDTDQAKAELTAFGKQVTNLGRRRPRVVVSADTKAALARLTGVEKALDRINGRTARVNISGTQTGAGSAPGGGGRRPFSGMPPAASAAAWTIAPAAIPAATALTAALGGVVSGFGAATTGAVAFGTAAVPALVDVAQVIELQKQSVEGGAEAVEAYEKALADLTPEGRRTVETWGALTDSYDRWQRSLQSDTLPVVNRGIRLLQSELPSLTPIVRSSAAGFDDLLESAEGALDAPHWERFVSFASRQAGPSIGILGRSIGNLAVGTTGLVASMEPLWTRVGPGLENLTARFADWSNEQTNFTNFISWSIQNGPVFAETFGAIAQAGVDVGEALLPLGVVYAPMLTTLAEAISAVAETAPWLIQLAVAAKTASVGVDLLSRANQAVLVPLREAPGRVQEYVSSLSSVEASSTSAAGGSNRFRNALSGVSGALGGPWGLAVTAALALGGAWLAQANERRMAEQAWADALIQSSGAIDGNITSLAAKQLAESGALAAAEAAGVSQQRVVDGLLREGAERRALLTLYDELHGAVQLNSAGMDAWGRENEEFTAALQTLYGEGVRWSELTATQQQQVQALADGTHGLIGEFQAGQESYALISEATAAQTGQQDGLNTSMANGAYQARDLRTALEELTGSRIGAVEAEIGYQDALDRATESVAANGTTIDLNTEAGRANQQALIDLASAANEHLVAMDEAEVGTGELTAAQRRQRDAFIDVAEQMGYTASEARDLADEYLGIPSKVDTAIRVNAQGQWSFPAQQYGPGGAQLYATGGFVSGPGTATSDSIPAMLSDGEFVQPTRTVDYYGVGFMEAIRHRQIPKEDLCGALPGFATGGYARKTSNRGGIPWELIDDHRGTIKPEWNDMVMALIGRIGGKMAQIYASQVAGPMGVVKLAEKSIGRFPESNGNNTNAITNWFGMNGAPWCAMFISWLFDQVKAGRSLGAARRTAWTGDYYGSGMKRVSTPMPGDVAVYGTSHVNLIASEGGGRRIGGNQSNNVTAAPYSGGAIFRPMWDRSYATGGLVEKILDQDRHEDDAVYSDPGVYGLRKLAGLARGGLADGWTVVGEEGPELARFDDPARIYSRTESARLLADAARIAPTARGGDGATTSGPLIGQNQIHLHNSEATVREAFTQLEHDLHVLSRGGRYM